MKNTTNKIIATALIAITAAFSAKIIIAQSSIVFDEHPEKITSYTGYESIFRVATTKTDSIIQYANVLSLMLEVARTNGFTTNDQECWKIGYVSNEFGARYQLRVPGTPEITNMFLVRVLFDRDTNTLETLRTAMFKGIEK